MTGLFRLCFPTAETDTTLALWSAHGIVLSKVLDFDSLSSQTVWHIGRSNATRWQMERATARGEKDREMCSAREREKVEK